MTSKSELKRLCHMDPAAMAERLAKLERVAEAAEKMHLAWLIARGFGHTAIPDNSCAGRMRDALRAAGYLEAENKTPPR